MFDLLKRVFTPAIEKRSTGSGFTAEVMRMREAYISGRTGLGELTGTVSACTSLWSNGFALANVQGTDMLDSFDMALLGRSLAVRGEFVALIRDGGLVPCSDWDCRTRDGEPIAYRVSVPEAGGGRSETALAGEVVHVRINVDPAAPWLGVSPLRTASLSAGMLHTIEQALAEVYENAPLGSQIVPMPEQPDQDNANLGRSFRGQRGRVLLRESVAVSAAGGPTPQTDWRPSDVTPDIQKSMSIEALTAARESIAMAYGILPSLFNGRIMGALVREAQRHLAHFTLQPLATIAADELSDKLGGDVTINVVGPLNAFDSGGRSRAFGAVATALVAAKAGGVSVDEIQAALDAVDPGND